MHGGHYTAVSKVEEAVVQDIVSERCFGHTSCSSGGGSAVGTDKTGLHQGAQQETSRTGDGLSLSELIASQWSHVSGNYTVTVATILCSYILLLLFLTINYSCTVADTAQGSGSAGFDSTTATTSANTTTADAWRGLSAQSSELPSPHSLKWMKFDDEFVNALPSAGMYNSVVTGMNTCTIHILYVGRLILLYIVFLHYYTYNILHIIYKYTIHVHTCTIYTIYYILNIYTIHTCIHTLTHYIHTTVYYIHYIHTLTHYIHTPLSAESAFLLFYKRKQLSEKNILKYL